MDAPHLVWSQRIAAAVLLLSLGAPSLRAEVLIPGTGRLIEHVGDNFEDRGWQYLPNAPKSTRDIDDQEHRPSGESINRRWYEGMKRGQPDVVRRVETPMGGIPGSHGSLLLQSLWTGVPGRPRYQMGQDDFVADVSYRLGGAIPVGRSPSVVVRVFLPPVDTWENRSGAHFGFRAALTTTVAQPANNLWYSNSQPKEETYWTGMFIEFHSKSNGNGHDYACFRLRADRNGNDFQSRQITTTGWWTLGCSFTPDGMVHYFAGPGVENLTQYDHIASQYPYGYRAERFKTFFFNVCSADDGRTWSTPWIIDDPMVFLAN
jgi:hypothetical protein